MSAIDLSLALTAYAAQTTSTEIVTSAIDDLFGSLLASRAHFLTTLSTSDELTQERFREQSAHLAELISDFGNIHRALIAERERYRDLKTGHESELKSYGELIRDISAKVALINRDIAALSGDSVTEELTTDITIVATASDVARRELTTLATAVDALALGLINVSTKIDQEAVKLTAATSEVEVLKAQLAAARVETENLKASHAAQVASISASAEARVQAEKVQTTAWMGCASSNAKIMNRYQSLYGKPFCWIEASK